MRTELLKTKHSYHTEQTIEDLANGYEIPLSEANDQYRDAGEPGRYDHKWDLGLKTRADVAAVLNEGWQDGADRMGALARELAVDVPPAQSRIRKARFADAGDDLVIDRALRGEWDHAWRTSKREITSGPQTVDLIAQFGGNCNRSAEELFWAGAAMLVCADILESAGYSVRVIGSLCTDDRHGRQHRADIIAKDSNEPLRIDALASVFAHAGIFRTLGFREIMRAPWNVGQGLGTSTPLLASNEDIRPNPENAIALNAVFDKRGAIEAIRKVLVRVQG